MKICYIADENNNVISMGTVEGEYIPIQNSIIIEVNDNFDFEKKYRCEDNKLIEISTQ